MQRILYSVIFYFAVPLIILRLLLRSIKAPAYRRRIAERFAWFELPAGFEASKQTIWIHAVSVGEVMATGALIRQLQQRYANAQIIVTTMTPTGSDRVKDLFGEAVYHSYIPYDLPGATNRFINKVNPSLLILMETELWPNLVYCCHRRGVKLILANARLSEKSARSYARFSKFTRAMLSQIDCIAAQAQADARRFIELGADDKKVTVTGSLKFNIEIDQSEPPSSSVFSTINESGRTVWIAASTREGEESKVLSAFQQVLQSDPSILLLLVPRHPERFDKVARLCTEKGFNIGRRSLNQSFGESTQVYLGDSMGEMQSYYRLANIAFVGGSLVDTGCQNVLEPAALGIPVIVGPSQFNFATICLQLEQAGALRTVRNEDELASLVIELSRDRAQQQSMGASGKELVKANQNALPALMLQIEKFVVNK